MSDSFLLSTSFLLFLAGVLSFLLESLPFLLSFSPLLLPARPRLSGRRLRVTPVGGAKRDSGPSVTRSLVGTTFSVCSRCGRPSLSLSGRSVASSCLPRYPSGYPIALKHFLPSDVQDIARKKKEKNLQYLPSNPVLASCPSKGKAPFATSGFWQQCVATTSSRYLLSAATSHWADVTPTTSLSSSLPPLSRRHHLRLRDIL